MHKNIPFDIGLNVVTMEEIRENIVDCTEHFPDVYNAINKIDRNTTEANQKLEAIYRLLQQAICKENEPPTCKSMPSTSLQSARVALHAINAIVRDGPHDYIREGLFTDMMHTVQKHLIDSIKNAK